MAAFDWDRLQATVAEHIDAGEVPGAVLAVSCGGDLCLAALGRRSIDGAVPLTGDAVFRISSMTKPLMAALTLMLVEDGSLALDAPVERWLPELGDRRVLRHRDGPIDDTVAADCSIQVEDLLTLRMGFGFVFDSPCPAVDWAVAAGLGMGPPDPAVPLSPDEWVARFAALPLLHQPGADWMYEFGFGVLGVLLARAGGQHLDDLLRERLLTPLGMTDTGFVVAAPARHRLIPCYSQGEDGLELFDSAEESRWSRRPRFPDARGGLTSTASDYLRFARMLLDGGMCEGRRLLTQASVRAMTTNRLGPEQAHSASAEIFLSSGAGWGYGLEVIPAGPAAGHSAARYGWGGGLGTTWYSFPELDTAAVLFTQCLPPPEPLVSAFWSTLMATLRV